MSKKTKQTLDHSRVRTLGLQSAKGATLDVLSVPGSTRTDSELADKHREDANVEVSPEGTLPVISVPGGTQKNSELADKQREDPNAEVSSRGALPVISVPGGS